MALKDKLTVCKLQNIATGMYSVHIMVKQGPNWYSLGNGSIILYPTIAEDTIYSNCLFHMHLKADVVFLEGQQMESAELPVAG